MNAQDELTRVIVNFHDKVGEFYDEADLADAILAAGYSKPRVITTIEELEGLPVASAVHDRYGAIVVNARAGWERNAWGYAPRLPATVLYEPTS